MTDISFIIPFIHEYPTIYPTINDIQTEMHDSPYSYEILPVENAVVDPNTERAFTGRKALYRALIRRGVIRYFFEPRQCGPIARNTGAREARGTYIIFMDAHTTLGKNTISPLVQLLEETPECGSVSGLTAWSHYDAQRLGSYYELFHLPGKTRGGPTLLTHMHGHYMGVGRVGRDPQPFRCVMGSQAYTMYRRKEFIDVGGYFEGCRFYPHPEGYMPIKMWMCGYEVYCHPASWHIHGMFHRHYQRKQAELNLGSIRVIANRSDIAADQQLEEIRNIFRNPYADEGVKKRVEYGGHSWQWHRDRNVLMIAYILGDEKWLNLCADAFKPSTSIIDSARKTVDDMGTREWLRSRQVMSLDKLLTMARLSMYPPLNPKRIWGMEKWDPRIGDDPLQ